MQPFPILLVDDDALDVKSVRRAFEEAKFRNPLFVAKDGQDGIDFLYRKGSYAAEPPENCPRPGLILLDLRMPRLDGIGFLEAIRADPELATTPVVVLTTSNEDEQRVESYRLGAAGYIKKPLDFDRFLEVTRVLHAYWTLVELP